MPGWRGPVSANAAIELLRGAVGAANIALDPIRVLLAPLGLSLPPIFMPLSVGHAQVPAQAPGAVVRYRGTATDVDGNSSISPKGLFYADKGLAETKVLVVDPHVRLRVAQEAFLELAATAEANSAYSVPDGLLSDLEDASSTAQWVLQSGLVPFHNWQWLSSRYDLFITTPAQVGQALDDFGPDVVVLSNLFLGIGPGDLFDWDLKSHQVIDDLVTYVKTNNAGLIVTHGTLSDWIIWTSPEGRIAVGARGNVGESIGDLNLVNERTVAALLGMPHLAFPEAIRDEVAQLLASLPPPDNVPGLLLGSVPLQVPFVPFDGEIQPTEQGRGHPILEGLGDDFTVSTPGLHQTLGLESVTQVGWQLAFPQVLARQAWEASRKPESTEGHRWTA